MSNAYEQEIDHTPPEESTLREQVWRFCRTEEAADNLVQLIQERELLARISELEQQHSWIIDFNDDVAFNLEKRIEELNNQAVKVKAVTK